MCERKEDQGQQDLDIDSKEELGILGSKTVQLGRSSRRTFRKPLFKELKVSPQSNLKMCRALNQCRTVAHWIASKERNTCFNLFQKGTITRHICMLCASVLPNPFSS